MEIPSTMSCSKVDTTNEFELVTLQEQWCKEKAYVK
jgi:hypothetical protein